jgi:hypothetical protein
MRRIRRHLATRKRSIDAEEDEYEDYSYLDANANSTGNDEAYERSMKGGEAIQAPSADTSAGLKLTHKSIQRLSVFIPLKRSNKNDSFR